MQYENIKFTDNGKSMNREYCFDGILITFNYWNIISKTKVKNQPQLHKMLMGTQYKSMQFLTSITKSVWIEKIKVVFETIRYCYSYIFIDCYNYEILNRLL